MTPWEVLLLLWANLPQLAALCVLTESSLFIPILIVLYRRRLLPVILTVLETEKDTQERFG